MKHQNTLEGDIKGVTDNIQSLNVAPTSPRFLCIHVSTPLLFESSASSSGRQFADAPDASYQTLSLLSHIHNNGCWEKRYFNSFYKPCVSFY